MPLDQTLFRQHMAGTSMLEILLKGHLWVEYALNRALEIRLEDASAVELDRSPFARKVALAQGIGALCAGSADMLRVLNRLRNRLAHQLSAEPSSGDLDVLEESLHGLARTIFEQVGALRTDPTPEQRLRFAIYCIVYVLEFENMMSSHAKTYDTEIRSFEVVRAVEHRVRGDSARSDAEILEQCGVPARPDPREVWVNHGGPDVDFGDGIMELRGT